RHPAARRTALIAAGLVVAFGLGGLAMTRLGANPAPEAELLVAWTGADGLPRDVARSALALEGWTEGRPLANVALERRGAWRRTPFSEYGTTVISQDGSQWASEAAFPDSGELDVVLHDRSGASRRLTFARGDDRPAAFSPDGTLLAIATARWNANGHSNLALIDVRTGAMIRRLTQGDSASEFAARWSPDGSRLAFTRTIAGGDSSVLCWVTMDARRERCLSIAPWQPSDQIGFADNEHFLVHVTNATVETTLNVDLGAATFSRTTIPPAGHATLDATGRWLLVSLPDTAGSAALRIGPALAFERARAFVPQEIPGAHVNAWIRSGPSDYIASLQIMHSSPPIALGVPNRLRVVATTRTGRRTVPPIVLWRSLTPTIAAVDSDGVLVARDTGRAIVEASAGGWRTTLDTIPVVRSAAVLAADERWTNGVEARWRFYGEPLPLVVDDSRGGRAFFNNGDGEFYSGAYSIGAYDASRGLAIDAEFSAPITRTQWQMISVGLRESAEFALMAQWDHRTGYPPAPASSQPDCAFVYPRGEGPLARTRAAGADP
ncbi:MAG: TolB family protein, partial [Gemmatimonadales bacterium]